MLPQHQQCHHDHVTLSPLQDNASATESATATATGATAMELSHQEESLAVGLFSPSATAPTQVEHDSGGPFRLLPTEIVQHLFSFLPMPDLGNLALSSLWMRQAVQDWTSTRNCLNRISHMSNSNDAKSQQQAMEASAANHPQHYPNSRELAFRLLRSSSLGHRGYAILVKRLTCLQSTHDRVRVALAAFDRALSYQNEGDPWNCRRRATSFHKIKGNSNAATVENEKKNSQDWLSTLYVVRFSLMTHVFSRGWDESEYPVLAAAIDHKFGLEQRLRTFLTSSRRRDVCISSEMHLRLTLRALTWDFAGSDYGHRAVLASTSNILISPINNYVCSVCRRTGCWPCSRDWLAIVVRAKRWSCFCFSDPLVTTARVTTTTPCRCGRDTGESWSRSTTMQTGKPSLTTLPTTFMR